MALTDQSQMLPNTAAPDGATKFADIAGVSLRTIQRIESGKPASFESLRAIASAFDLSVEKLLAGSGEPSEASSISFLVRVTSGRDLLMVVGGADAFQFDQDELSAEDELELVADFLQDLQDYGEIWDDIGAAEHVRTMHRFTERIETLSELGFWVFALRNKQEWVSGNPKTALDVATVFVGRASNPRIVAVKTRQPVMPNTNWPHTTV